MIEENERLPGFFKVVFVFNKIGALINHVTTEETVNMAQLFEALRSTAAKWRAGNQEHREGVVLVWEGEVYGWKNELRDPASERPGAYAVDKAGLVFQAKGGDDYNGAKAWVAVDPDGQ